ncbi:PREDICTED: uncharacterized protein LOC104759103 [Camelina sativa]|uniref:Uncharacterized protein LOC104759103 n=1 Tax=Camelina sativa TaxID=90675 RepID=A0ABM0X482_CAMSA|nr:PREDICTED: uncharacterized protein LOC104759103 [Camelina sativa]
MQKDSFPEMVSDDPTIIRSGTMIHQEETSYQTSEMAEVDLLEPSITLNLVRMSMAHDGSPTLASSSCTGDLKLHSVTSSSILNLQPPSLSSPEMTETLNPTSAQPGRRMIRTIHPLEKLGFPLLGPTNLGPLRFWSPLPLDVAIVPHMLLSRFARNSNPSHPRQLVCRFMEPFVRRLHLESKSPLLLDWLRLSLGNLLLVLPFDSALEGKCLNELGIMIQTIRRCDYRCIFTLPSPSRLPTKNSKLQFFNFVKFPPKTLKISGIMIPTPWSGGYHLFCPSCTQYPVTLSIAPFILNQSICNPAHTSAKALLRVDILTPMRFPTLASLTSLSLQSKSAANFSSTDLSLEVTPILLDLTGSIIFHRNWFIALKTTISMTPIYLCTFVILALVIAYLCCYLNFVSYLVCGVLF